MTDERIDALIRRLDVPSDPDPEFVRSTYRRFARGRAQHASGDASRIGRLRARPAPGGGRRALAIDDPTGRHVGSRRAAHPGDDGGARRSSGPLNRVQPIRNGPLIVSIDGELQAIDVVDGSVRTMLPPGDGAKGVSRSPDGRLVAFWTIDGGQSHLWVIGVDGRDRRELASDLSLGWTDAIDVWSSDSRFLATEVRLDGEEARIIVADVVTGSARAVTPQRAHRPQPPVVSGRPFDRLHRGGKRDAVARRHQDGWIRQANDERRPRRGRRARYLVPRRRMGLLRQRHARQRSDAGCIGPTWRADSASSSSGTVSRSTQPMRRHRPPTETLIVFIVPRSDRRAVL